MDLQTSRIGSFLELHTLNSPFLQVLVMVVFEILFFIYWELWSVDGHGGWDFIIAETSNILFFDALIVPYLLFNGFVTLLFHE